MILKNSDNGRYILPPSLVFTTSWVGSQSVPLNCIKNSIRIYERNIFLQFKDCDIIAKNPGATPKF